jgi:hypothetical protein
MIGVAVVLASSSCLTPGDPQSSPVGLVLVAGHAAAIVPPCQREAVVGMSVEIDPNAVGEHTSEQEALLWQVADPRNADAHGPFVLGDVTPWSSVMKPLHGALPNGFIVSVETRHRLAQSFVTQARLEALRGDQVLIDGTVGSLADLEKKWEC